MDDLRNVIRMQGQELDWPYIHDWCDQHGTRDLLDGIVQGLKSRGFL